MPPYLEKLKNKQMKLIELKDKKQSKIKEEWLSLWLKNKKKLSMTEKKLLKNG